MKLKEKASLQGRSLIFNVLFVVANLAGLSLLVMAYHPAFETSSTLLFTLALILMLTSAGGLILFKGKLMMASVSRVLVGGLFIVSGLVKANDPLGFSTEQQKSKQRDTAVQCPSIKIPKGSMNARQNPSWRLRNIHNHLHIAAVSFL